MSAAAEKGSVITKDHYVKILCSLAGKKEYNKDILALLNEQLLVSLPNQLPSYAEQALPYVTDKWKAVFVKTLQSRIDDLEQESKRKRLEKAIKKLQ